MVKLLAAAPGIDNLELHDVNIVGGLVQNYVQVAGNVAGTHQAATVKPLEGYRARVQDA